MSDESIVKVRDLVKVYPGGNRAGNSSDLRGNKELSAGGEWVEVLCAPGAED